MTRLWTSLSNRNLLALVAFTAALAPQVLKAADELCPQQNATLEGTYMVHGSGTVVGVGPIASTGVITYDGKGSAVNTFTASLNGTIVRHATLSGPYTVNTDCTGTLVLGTSISDQVISPDGNTIFWIEADTGIVFSGEAVRLRHSE
jgi:hypothetical protein